MVVIKRLPCKDVIKQKSLTTITYNYSLICHESGFTTVVQGSIRLNQPTISQNSDKLLNSNPKSTCWYWITNYQRTQINNFYLILTTNESYKCIQRSYQKLSTILFWLMKLLLTLTKSKFQPLILLLPVILSYTKVELSY